MKRFSFITVLIMLIFVSSFADARMGCIIVGGQVFKSTQNNPDWICEDGYYCGNSRNTCYPNVDPSSVRGMFDGPAKPTCGYGKEPCGTGCMPAGNMCCETFSCQPGTFCGESRGKCTRPKSPNYKTGQPVQIE